MMEELKKLAAELRKNEKELTTAESYMIAVQIQRNNMINKFFGYDSESIAINQRIKHICDYLKDIGDNIYKLS